MKRHLGLSFLGILLGLAALAWIQPNTSEGATFLLLISVAVANLAGALVSWAITQWKPKPPVRP